MTDWTTPADLKRAVAKLWTSGSLLRAAWSGEGLAFPYRMNLKGPSSSQWSERFEEARRWIAGWDGAPVVWREFNHPRLGRNRVPTAVEWTSVDDLVAFAGKRAETRRFIGGAQALVAEFPPLGPWVGRRPHQLLDHIDVIDELIAVTRWMVAHPRPNLFFRQVDVPGVHTKFLEAHRGLLSEWFDLVLPPAAIDPSFTGAGQFSLRYGFATKPRFIRFRPLDPALPGPRDLAWRWEDWFDGPPRKRLVVVENEVTYLSLPPLADAWAVFGAGYGFEGWGRSSWLSDAEVWYWGDLDTHGFAILDQFRAEVPQVISVLMDAETLVNHRSVWGREETPARRKLSRLTADEQAVYQGLVGDLWAPSLRLEQELVGQSWVEKAWEGLLPPGNFPKHRE